MASVDIKIKNLPTQATPSLTFWTPCTDEIATYKYNLGGMYQQLISLQAEVDSISSFKGYYATNPEIVFKP